MLRKSSFCQLSPWRVGAVVFLWTALSPAATWTGAGRTTPALTEIAAVDATGEVDATGQPNWLYGFEDLAGDGYIFKQPEQSIDVRTAYAATDPQRFWARIYVSDVQTPGGNVSGFVFIDKDRNTATGGTTQAPEINPQFTTAVSSGYEYVLELPGSGTTTQVWQYQAGGYVANPIPAAQGVAESGVDLDPIRINALQHGYLQASVDLQLVGLTEACTANLYFRSVNKQAAIGKSDLEVGQVTSCIPATNSSGVPTVLLPPTGCTSNAQCAAGGICQAGQCVFAVPCATNADCAANMTCTPDGRCVPNATGNCTTNADCTNPAGLVCVSGQCTACTSNSQCGAGEICGPNGLCIPDQGVTGTCTTTANCATGLVCSNGQCVACTSNSQCSSGLVCQASRCVSGTGAGGSGGGIVLQDGEKVEGGAWNCAMPGGGRSTAPAGMLLILPLLASVRRRARRKAQRAH